MPNVSELERIRTDIFDEFDYWKEQLRSGIHGKETKEYLLRELRAAASRKGIAVPGYNTPDFKEFLSS
jgi:hypothetical protein